MDVSVIICTYNRGADLRATLERLHAEPVGPGIAWELLVVDNNSSDDTPEVVASFADRLPIRYLRESRQGKSYALNTGLAAATAPLLLMTDDDVDVTPGYIRGHVEAAQNYPKAVFFGGRVQSRWVDEPPAWMRENLDWLRTMSTYERGDEPIVIDDYRSLPIGANLGLRREVFEAGFHFSPQFGPSGDRLSSSARHGGEESDYLERLLAKGYTGVYVPQSLVHHRERSYRLTRRYVRFYYREAGREVRRKDGLPPAVTLFGVPRYLWSKLSRQATAYAFARVTGSSRRWLKAETELFLTWGDFVECRQMLRSQTGQGGSSLRRFVKSLLPKVVLQELKQLREAWVRRQEFRRSSADVFTEIYRQQLWGKSDEPFCSGGGSTTPTVVEPYVEAVRRHLEALSPRPGTIVDLGCGDFRLGQRFLDLTDRYVGVDVVPDLIAHHREKFGNERVSFEQLDIANDPLPPGDVCFIRQVLQHLPNAAIGKVLPKLRQYRFVFITEHHPSEAAFRGWNFDRPPGMGIRVFEGSGVYLDKPPFNLDPAALKLILEVPSHEFEPGIDPGVIRTYLWENPR